MSKKEYYAEYHKRTYVPKINNCDVCNKDLTGNRKKRCKECKAVSVCNDCGKCFSYRVKYKRCPKCQYHWYKKNCPEGFSACYSKRNKEFSEKRSLEIRW